jgi:anti-anti-sigma factor
MSMHYRGPFLRVENAEEVTRVTLATRELGEVNLQAIGEELFAIADRLSHHGRLELDLGEVRYLTSTALGKLLGLHKRVRDRGGRLVIANVTDLVHEIFEVTQLHRILDVRRLADSSPCSPTPAPLAS